MSKNEQELIFKVLRKVAEEFAFMFVEEPEEEVEATPPYIKSNIGFNNHIRGEIEMIAPKDLCKVLVSNVLGLDELPEEDEESGELDALCEFLNIFCGNFITEKIGTEAVYDLRPPKANVIPTEEWDKLKNDEEYCVFLLDDYPLLIKVCYQ